MVSVRNKTGMSSENMYTFNMSKIQKISFEANLIPVGSFVILIGLLLLATTNQWIGLSARNSWPISILVPGLIMLVAGLRTKGSILSSLLAFFGTLMTLLDVFFFLFTLQMLQWSDMSNLWPAFILAPGLAFLVVHWVSDRSGKLLVPGVVLSIGALIATLLVQVSGSLINAKSIGPILVIAAGISLVVFSWLRKSNR